MKITESQLELLRSLKCERLSSKPENFSLIDDFYNTRNNSLVDTLQGDAYDDDEIVCFCGLMVMYRIG